MKKIWKLLMLVSLIFLLISCGKKKEEKPLVMGLSPIANSEKLIEDTAPLHKMLGDEIGRPVEGFIATNYIGVVEALGTGTIDFALIPPFAYILANKKNGTEALLTSINKHDEPGYYSVLLVEYPNIYYPIYTKMSNIFVSKMYSFMKFISFNFIIVSYTYIFILKTTFLISLIFPTFKSGK